MKNNITLEINYIRKEYIDENGNVLETSYGYQIYEQESDFVLYNFYFRSLEELKKEINENNILEIYKDLISGTKLESYYDYDDYKILFNNKIIKR